MGCIQDIEVRKNQKHITARTVKSAMMIQRWYRRYLARIILRKKIAWSVFHSIEQNDYREQADVLYFYLYLIFKLPNIIHRNPEEAIALSATPEIDQIFSDYIDEFYLENARIDEDEPACADYQGPIINFPIKRHDIILMIDYFRQRYTPRMHPKYACTILRLSAMHLKSKKNLLAMRNVPKTTIVGDLRGSLTDLLIIFHKNGLPSDTNPYIFNGNYVDGGPHGIELFLIILSCYLAYPRHVHLHRGFHEDKVMNDRFGFRREVQEKYGTNAPLMLYLIEEVYRWLPIGTVLFNKIMVLPGGIPGGLDLKKILSIQRDAYISVVRPPIRGTFDRKEWKRFVDILWSDPYNEAGCVTNKLRGAGLNFGQDITESFLRKHKMNLVIRSSECVEQGFELVHNRRLVTLFSVSNFYALGSNHGAYIVVDDKMKAEIVKFVAYALNFKSMRLYDKYMAIENEVLHQLGAIFYLRRSELQQAFQRFDFDNTGLVTMEQWRFCMESSAKMALPWQVLIYMMGKKYKGKPSLVAYEKTLSIINDDKTREAFEKRIDVADVLYFNTANLKIVFKMADVDNSGYITLEEFLEIYDLMSHFVVSEITKEDVVYWFHIMDVNKKGAITERQFLLIFRFCKLYPNAGIDQPNDLDLFENLNTHADEN